MKRTLLALFTMFALWPKALQADMFLYPTKHVNTVIVCGHGVDCARAQRIFKMSQDYILESVNVSLDIKKVIEIPEDMSGEPEDRGVKWEKATQRVREENKAGITVVYITAYPESLPSIDFPSENVAGLSSAIGCVGKVDCLCYSKIFGNDKISSRVATHELGHLLGSYHTPDGIMAPSVQENQFAEGYSAATIAMIQYYAARLP